MGLQHKPRCYCGPVPEAPWPVRLTRLIADEIRHHRQALGLSAQQLADRCAQLGLDIPRATLADLENKRRANLAIAELLIIARALEISPLLLIAPVGRQETMEILPGLMAAPWDAIRWLEGEVDLQELPEGQIKAVTPEDWDEQPLFLFGFHQRLIFRWRSAQKAIFDRPDQRGAWLAEIHQEVADELRRVRSRMRRLGLTPPPLPPELDDVDVEAGQ